MKARTLAASPCDKLAFGEFYGHFERRFDIAHFSLGLVAPDDIWRNGRMHTHEAAHIIIVVEGEYVSTARNRERLLPSRSVIYVPAGTTHANHPATPKTRILAISISPEQIQQALDYVRLPESELDLQYGEIAWLARRLEAECELWGCSSSLVAAGVCLEMLGAFGARAARAETTPPRWLKAAREFLYERCCDAVSIEAIATEVGVHAIHLSRTFRRFYGCTPGGYLRACRIERATALLHSGNRALSDVAQECGFADQSHFCKVFKRHVGRTPAEFRRDSCLNV
jgi:AraC family transcriptional regulator